MTDRDADIKTLYEGLAFVSRQSRELGAQLHPELPLVAHSLLMFIDAEPNTRAVDVAVAYGLDKSTVSRQVAQLEAAGLLVRTGERPGRRGHVLELTEAGATTLRRAEDSSLNTLAAHLSGWDDEDLETLARLLGRFTETSRQARLSLSGQRLASPRPAADHERTTDSGQPQPRRPTPTDRQRPTGPEPGPQTSATPGTEPAAGAPQNLRRASS